MKTFNLNRLAKVMLLALVPAVLSLSCKKEEVIIEGNAKFRLVNAVQGSPAQDFYQGETKISTTAISYGQVSESLTVKAGNSTVSFKDTGTQNLSASGLTGVSNNEVYTVFYIKNNSGAGQITGYPEINAVPPSGMAGVRFVNLAVGLTSGLIVNFSNGDVLTNTLDFGIRTDYAVINPTAELKFSLVGAVNSTIIPAATFQSGKLYTVWFDATSATTAQYHVVVQN